MDFFRQWWLMAVESDILEPNAMALATVDIMNQPACRMVLLKGITAEGFEFYTNYNSRKALEMDQHPKVALLFFWKELERQIRIEGRVEKVSEERSREYFQSRPKESQIGAWASPQSEVIPDRSVLDDEVRKLEKEYDQHHVLPLPDDWGGYLVRPQLFEFWQGRANRLHDRFQYTLHEGEWIIERLAP
jgi:pyridoxamine 5'-phosphate oxidase